MYLIKYFRIPKLANFSNWKDQGIPETLQFKELSKFQKIFKIWKFFNFFLINQFIYLLFII